MNKLINVINMLESFRKSEPGCAWTQSQSLQTLAPQTIEEAYELAEAAELNNSADLKSELGDLLYHVLFYLIIAEEQQLFTFDDVCDDIIEKHERRMPDVAQRENYSADQVNEHWQKLKIKEREKQNSAFDSIPLNFPALTRCTKLQKRAVESKMHSNNYHLILEKMQKKLNELKESTNTKNQENHFNDIGELFFSVSDLARQLDVDSEAALRQTNRHYEERLREREKN